MINSNRRHWPLDHSVRRTLMNLRRVGEEFRIRRRLDAAPPVLIYQMGKVGSSSLKASIAPVWPGLTIHTHNIFTARQRQAAVRLLDQEVLSKERPTFIITLVREPIGRNISAFFQNLRRYTGVEYGPATFSMEELIGIFLKKHNHSRPLTWFDTRFKPLVNIDVYEHKFPSNGMQVIQHRNLSLLLMRCEVPDALKELAVREFLKLPIFSLSSSNVAAQKPYAETYRKFVEAFVPPTWYIREMYESRYFHHFYNQGESTEGSVLLSPGRFQLR
jgi:hypothetical protein